MTNFLKIAFLFIIFGITISCSSDNSTNNNSGDLVIGTIQASVDGKSWKTQQALATKVGTMYQVSGASIVSGTETMTLMIFNKEPGSYNNGIGSFGITDLTNPLNTITYSNTKVEYTITNSNDTEISGTFSFVGKNTKNESETKNIQNGKFRCKFVN